VLPAGAVPMKVGVVSLVRLSVLDAPVSEAATRSGTDGATTELLTIVIESGDVAALVLPAASVAVAVMACVPWARAELVTVQLPLESAVAVPIWVEPANTLTVLPASAVPVKVGVVSVVTLSVLDEPVSDAAVRSGVETAGAAASIWTVIADDAALVLPELFVAVAVMTSVPWPRVTVAVQLPPESAVVVPISVEPEYSFTVLPAGAVPVNVGVVSLVLLSVLDAPVSDAATRSGVDGGGTGMSIVTESAADAALVLPATSVAVAVML
jgi:hypothetical protein